MPIKAKPSFQFKKKKTQYVFFLVDSDKKKKSKNFKLVQF